MKIRVSPLKSGGEDPVPLSPQQMQEWNAYVDFVEKKGYKGSPLLDKKETNLSKTLFDQFKKENPTVAITYDIVPSVQFEMQKLKDSAQAFAKRRNDPNANNIMSGVSKVDGWAGSKTTQFRFPTMTEKSYLNNSLMAQKDLGLVNSQLQPTSQNSIFKKPIPKGVKLEKLQGGIFYENADGDLVKVD